MFSASRAQSRTCSSYAETRKHAQRERFRQAERRAELVRAMPRRENMPKGNVFGKPSAEPNLFELCRGEKTCPKGTFSASRAQSQAMLGLCRGEKTCPKERLVCRARNSLHGTRCKHARQTRYKSSGILFYPSIYLMYRRPWTCILNPASDCCNSRLWPRIQVPTHPRTPASNRGFCRKSDRNEITALLVRHGI